MLQRCRVSDGIPFLDKAFKDLPEEQVHGFMERSHAIGLSLLKGFSKNRADEAEGEWQSRLAGRALGYGNRGMLLASPFNVPTQTFTLIWSRGNVNGAAWQPLMRRRKKH